MGGWGWPFFVNGKGGVFIISDERDVHPSDAQTPTHGPRAIFLYIEPLFRGQLRAQGARVLYREIQEKFSGDWTLIYQPQTIKVASFLRNISAT